MRMPGRIAVHIEYNITYVWDILDATQYRTTCKVEGTRVLVNLASVGLYIGECIKLYAGIIL